MNDLLSREGLSKRSVTLWLLAFAVVYAVVVVFSWNLGHLDFGDGNYMYISWRVMNGATLYRDILAPQPPMHFLIGAALIKCGGLFTHPLYAFRCYSLLLHLLSMFLVYKCTVRLASGGDAFSAVEWRPAGLWAAALYLLIPIGFWWTCGYQSEPTEMLFILGAFLLTMSFKPWPAAGAGALMALAVLTNMTALPYALFIGAGLLIRRPRLGGLYWLLFLPITIGAFMVAEYLTGACYENVFLNQVGSYPRPELLGKTTVWGYFATKLMTEGGDIIRLDGGFIILGLLGLAAYATRSEVSKGLREFVVLFCFCAFLSFFYVTKGGTVDYIFTIGEPFVAIMGGWFICHFLRTIRPSEEILKPSRDNLIAFGWWGAALLLAAVVFYPGLEHTIATLKQRSYEANEYQTQQIVNEILAAAPNKDDLIIAPPHYAFVAQRKIAQDYSELLLWTLKYLNEKVDKTDGRAMAVVRKLADMIKNHEIAFIALDMRQTARIPEITQAIDQYYMPLRDNPVRTLNTSLQFYVPRKQ